MKASFRFILAIGLWAPLALALGDDRAAQNQGGSPQGVKPQSAGGQAAAPKTDKVVEPDAVSAEDKALVRIREFEARIAEAGVSRHMAEAESFAEIVNPFAVRKRGRFYGSLYEYHRNDNFDARNFFDPVGKPLPEFKRNQFGGSLGMFVTGSLTLFGTYDGLRINKGSTILSHVPLPEMKRGDFSGLTTQLTDPLTGKPFEGNRIPESRIHPVATKMLSLLPDPNQADPDRNFLNNQPSINNTDTYSARVDYAISNDTKLFADYRLTRSTRVDAVELPGFGTVRDRRAQEFSLSYTHSFNQRTVGSFRLNVVRTAYQELSKDAGQSGLLESLGVEGVSTEDPLDEGYPEFVMEGYATLGLGSSHWSPETSFITYFEPGGSLTSVHGNHKLSLVFEVANRQVNNNRSSGLRRGNFTFNGYYTGDAFADFLLGIPNNARRAVGLNRTDLRHRRWRASFGDDWKINSKFNVSMSLAYNYSPMFRSVHDNIAVFMPLVFDPPPDGEIVVTGSQRAAELGLGGLKSGMGAYPDRNDWEPRLGLAYSPFGNNRLVLRSSYQFDYMPLNFWTVADYMGRSAPFYYVDEAQSSTTSPELDLSHPFNTLTPTAAIVRALDPHIRNGYAQNWRLSLQNEFFRNWNLEIAYEGIKATRVQRLLRANVPLPGPGLIQERRPNTDYGRFDIITGSGSSISHILDAELRKRLSRGFSVESRFTWNRTLSDDRFGPSNPRDLAAERSVANYPIPSRRRPECHQISERTRPCRESRIAPNDRAGSCA